MKYSKNAVYTRVVNAIKAQYPSANCTSRYVPKPSAFPACYIHEIDNFRPTQYTQLDFQDEQWESALEIQVVSNKSGTAATEAYGIFAVAEAAFSELYYRRFQETTTDDGTKFTVIGRFRRRIGGGDSMPANIYA